MRPDESVHDARDSAIPPEDSNEPFLFELNIRVVMVCHRFCAIAITDDMQYLEFFWVSIGPILKIQRDLKFIG
jgi:hypothetical protein